MKPRPRKYIFSAVYEPLIRGIQHLVDESPERLFFKAVIGGKNLPKIDRNAKFIKEISSENLFELETSLDSHSDVTSGMEGKLRRIREIAKLGIDTILVNRE